MRVKKGLRSVPDRDAATSLPLLRGRSERKKEDKGGGGGRVGPPVCQQNKGLTLKWGRCHARVPTGSHARGGKGGRMLEDTNWNRSCLGGPSASMRITHARAGRASRMDAVTIS